MDDLESALTSKPNIAYATASHPLDNVPDRKAVLSCPLAWVRRTQEHTHTRKRMETSSPLMG